jgi:hypothetical protein|tara:strand:+ start:201 stop:761 length:561 start_codon:yes stop_codon:yes gene_type:complete
MPDYSKSVIYIIRSKHNIYVGSTTDFKTRKYHHKGNITNENCKAYNRKLYKTIRQNAGEWDMQPHSIFPCNSKMELTIEEERIRQLLKADMNSQSCGTGLTRLEYNKQYHTQHRVEMVQYIKQYNEQHRDEICEQKKQYREQHREEIKEKKRQKVTCECGCDVVKYNLSRHRKSPKHHLLMEKLNQ